MSIPGTWTFYHCIDTTGPYDQTTVKISSDGTWSQPGAGTGRWASLEGYFSLTGDGGSSTVYLGSVQADAMLGMWTDYRNVNGSWYAVRIRTDAAPAANVPLRGFTSK